MQNNLKQTSCVKGLEKISLIISLYVSSKFTNLPWFESTKIRVSYDRIIQIIIQHIVTLPKYGHGELNICRPH